MIFGAALFCASCSRPFQAAAPLKLSILGFGLESGEFLREDALTEYGANTGIQFDLIPTPGTTAEQLPQVLDLFRKRAATPDVYLIDGTWPGTLHQHLLDLKPYLDSQARRHAKPLLENNTIHDRLVALPLYMNGGMLFYRIDLLKKYGYAAPPDTWNTLAGMAARIQNGERRSGRPGFSGYIWQGAAYEGLTCNALEWQVSFGGGNIVEKDGTISVNNQRARKALASAASWVGSISPNSVLAYTEADASNVFLAGNAAFMRHWSSAFQGFRQNMAPGSVGVALLPAGPAGRAHTIGGFQLAVSRYSKHTREAAALVLYLTGIQVQTRRALRRGFIPTYPELYQSPELLQALPQARVFAEAAPASWIFRPASVTGKRYSEVSEAYYQQVHEILSRRASTRTALVSLAQRLQTLTDNPAGRFQH